MALPIKKSDLGKGPAIPGPQAGQDDDFFNKLNAIVGGVNSVISNFNNSISGGIDLFGKFKDINDRLKGKNQQNSQQTGGAMKQGKFENVEPAVKPNQQKEAGNKEIVEADFKVIKEDKIAKAEAIFDSIHSMIKPKIPFMKLLTADAAISFLLGTDITKVKADVLLQLAMQKENRDKIIKAIAERI